MLINCYRLFVAYCLSPVVCLCLLLATVILRFCLLVSVYCLSLFVVFVIGCRRLSLFAGYHLFVCCLLVTTYV